MKNIPKIRFPEFSGEWVERRLGEVCDVRDGTHDSPKYIEKGYPLITSKNLSENGKIDFSNVNYISKEDFEKINKRSKVNKGDILFGMIGTIGNPVIVDKENFAIKNVALIKEKEQVRNKYLFYYLNSNTIKKQFFKENTGGTQKFIALNVIRKLKIHIPSTLEEQQKIASFMSSIDEKIDIVSKKIEKLKEYKKGIMQKLLNVKNGVPELRFPEFSGEWVEKRLGEVGEIVTGTTPSTKIKSYYENGTYTWITPTDINEDKNIFESERKLTEEGIKKGRFIPKNSLLVTCIASIGKNAILRKDGSCNQQINAIIPNKNTNVDFLYYMIESEKVKSKMLKFAGQTATPILNKSEFSNIKIHIPQTIEEQQKIASFLSTIDEKIELNEQKLTKLKEYKKGLLQKMFV